MWTCDQHFTMYLYYYPQHFNHHLVHYDKRHTINNHIQYLNHYTLINRNPK